MKDLPAEDTPLTDLTLGQRVEVAEAEKVTPATLHRRGKDMEARREAETFSRQINRTRSTHVPKSLLEQLSGVDQHAVDHL